MPDPHAPSEPASAEPPQNGSDARIAAEKTPEPEAAESTAESAAESTAESTAAPPIGAAGPAAAVVGRRHYTPWAALAVSLLALLIAGYAGYQVVVDTPLEARRQGDRLEAIERQFSAVRSEWDGFNRQIEPLQSKLAQLEVSVGEQLLSLRADILAQESVLKQQLQSSSAGLREQADRVRREFQRLSDSIAVLRSELGRNVDSWNLEEVEQLLVIANQRLQLSGDVGLAANVLRLADSRLQELANPDLAAVRRAIANEIAALDGVITVDIEGQINALDALINGIDALPLAGDPRGFVAGQSASQAADAGEENQGVVANLLVTGRSMLHDLADLVQVEKSDELVKPVLSTEIRQLIADRAKLIIESAQLAFLRRQDRIYVVRMQAARVWVQQRFDLEAAATRSWLARFDAQTAIVSGSELPDISASLKTLRRIMRAGG